MARQQLVKRTHILAYNPNPLRPKEQRGFDWFYTVGGESPMSNQWISWLIW